jgi:3-phenylpropionate/trans-cinnamate dioxygenase ferredoxin reductase component
MSKTKYLILGAGPASSWAVRGIRQEDKDGSITIVGKEHYRTYSLPLLSKGFIQGRYPEDKIYLVKEDFYESNGVTFINSNGASALNSESKTVTLEDGWEIAYEKLLICTGASPIQFPVPGGDMGNIFCLRTLDDAKAIRQAAERASKAVVVGGSFIGVELVCALREIGLDVDLLMLEDYVWQPLIPKPVGDYLMKIMRGEGVSVHPGKKVTEFKGEGGMATSLVTEDGGVFEGDLFGVGIGVRLNIDFLKDTEIEIGKGVLVNSQLETSVKDVYAAGDVAEYEDSILGTRHLTGHIENAQFQGRTAGRNMAGASVEYARVTGYDTEVFGSMLMFIGAPGYGQEHILRGSEDAPTGSFSLRDGRLVGALLINPGGKDIKAVRELISMRDTDFKRLEERLSDPETDLTALVEEAKD